MISRIHCHVAAMRVLHALQTSLEVAKRQFGYGQLPAVVTSYSMAAKNLGRLTALNMTCGLDAQKTVDRFEAAVDTLRDDIIRTCTIGRAASLSGTEIDPYEAYRKLRKPLPLQRSRPIGGKKGKKGYTRKHNKQRSKSEEGW